LARIAVEMEMTEAGGIEVVGMELVDIA